MQSEGFMRRIFRVATLHENLRFHSVLCTTMETNYENIQYGHQYMQYPNSGIAYFFVQMIKM